MPKTVDTWSLRATPLKLFCNKRLMGHATGFFWQTEQGMFLVTNWHVLSGRNPRTMECLDQYLAIPDELEYVRFIKTESYDEVFRDRVRLLDDDGNPIWLQHCVYGSDVDVGAVQIPSGSELMAQLGSVETYVHPINREISELQETVAGSAWRAGRRDMGENMFVIGFPLGTNVTGHFPIWKRASVASEMDVLLEGRPSFLIDTATREGMSGSPVIHRSFEIVHTYSTPLKPTFTDRFVGVYSGRHIGKLNEEAQLGIVWREEIVREIIAVRTLGHVDLTRLP